MRLTIHKKIGRTTYHFSTEGKNLYEVVQESDKLSFENVPACGICASDNLRLGSRLGNNKFKYVFVKCNDCKAELTFGHRQDDENVYYLRRNANGLFDWKEIKDTENPK